MVKMEDYTALISIEGSITEGHLIPSDVLSRVINGFQEVAWIIGAASEGVTDGEPSRRSSSLKKKYMIEWGLTKSGSYVLPLYSPIEQKISGGMMGILSAFAADSFEELKKLIPDSASRSKLFKATLSLLPKMGESWQLKYKSKNRSVAFDVKSHQKIEAWRTESLPSPQSNEVLTIKGELLRIDFGAKKITVRYPPTNRSIDCYYLPEIEDSILESRREPIEVTGCFTLDRKGNPERLTEVSTIQPVDLSEVILDQLEQGSRKLALIQSLTFAPSLDEETRQVYMICDDSIGVDIFCVNERKTHGGLG